MFQVCWVVTEIIQLKMMIIVPDTNLIIYMVTLLCGRTNLEGNDCKNSRGNINLISAYRHWIWRIFSGTDFSPLKFILEDKPQTFKHNVLFDQWRQMNFFHFSYLCSRVFVHYPQRPFSEFIRTKIETASSLVLQVLRPYLTRKKWSNNRSWNTMCKILVLTSVRKKQNKQKQ